MTQSIALPLHARCFHNFGNAFARINVEDWAGLHPIWRKPFPQIFSHDDLSFASRFRDSCRDGDRSAIKVDGGPRKPLVQCFSTHPAERDQSEIGKKIWRSRV